MKLTLILNVMCIHFDYVVKCFNVFYFLNVYFILLNFKLTYIIKIIMHNYKLKTTNKENKLYEGNIKFSGIQYYNYINKIWLINQIKSNQIKSQRY